MALASMSEGALRASVRSFIDLRRVAAEKRAGLPVHPATGGDAFEVRRRQLLECGTALQIGAIDLPAGSGEVPAAAADEFVIVCEGAVVVEHTGGAVDLKEGGSMVVPCGTGFSWRCERGATLIYMRHPGGRSDLAAVVPINVSAPLEPSSPPLAELLTSATPACRNHTDFRSVDGEFTCGTWDATPYSREAMLYRHCELMYLLDGAVTLEDEAGVSHTFSQHDIFVVEQGAQCSWESLEHVKKVYAIFRPA